MIYAQPPAKKYAAVFRPVEHSRQYCAVSQPKVEEDVAAAKATNINITAFMLCTKEFDWKSRHVSFIWGYCWSQISILNPPRTFGGISPEVKSAAKTNPITTYNNMTPKKNEVKFE